MTRQPLLRCLVLSLTATTFCWAQSSTQDDLHAADERIFREIQERNQLMENIEHLSDAIGPRLTGSKQLKTAEAWAVNLALQYNLENVHLESWQIAHFWQRGAAQAQILIPVLRRLTIVSAGWSPCPNGLVRGNVVYVAVRTGISSEPMRAS